ncbi:MAG: hypothetical protein WCS09_02890 [Pseudomonadota bacterium]
MSERGDVNSSRGRYMSLGPAPRVLWIRVGIEVLTPSGRRARVEGRSDDGFLQLTYADSEESVRLHERLVAPRNGDPVRIDRTSSRMASQIRASGLPRPGKG